MPSSSSPAVSRLLEAEKSADEIMLRAREDAERIVADARERAEEIRGGKGPGEGGNHEATGLRSEAGAEKARIERDVQLHIERIRDMAASRRAQAVESLVQTLFGQS